MACTNINTLMCFHDYSVLYHNIRSQIEKLVVFVCFVQNGGTKRKEAAAAEVRYTWKHHLNLLNTPLASTAVNHSSAKWRGGA